MAEKKTMESGEDLMTVQLFKDSKEYKDDQFVAVNGRSMKIQRGVEVTIPASHAEVLRQSMEQDSNTAMLIDSQDGKFPCLDGKV